MHDVYKTQPKDTLQ